MVSKILSLASFALAATQVYAAPLARRDAYDVGDWSLNEDFSVFEARYTQLNCVNHRGASREDADQFYWDCCHPILRSQTIDVFPESCGLKPNTATVAAETPSSTPAAEPTPTPTPTPAVVETPSATPEVLPAVTTPAPEAPAPSPSPEAPAPAPAPSPANPPASGGQAGIVSFFFQNGNAGACGDFHPDTDQIVALPAGFYGDFGQKSPLCGHPVFITNTQNGNTVTAIVADACPTCNENQLDLSTGAFDALGPRDQGILPVTFTIA